MFESCALLLLAFSHHFNTETDFNERHASLGVTCKESPLGTAVSAGYYYNSERDHTGWVARRDYIDDGRFFYELGAAVGYAQWPVAPFVRVGYDADWVELFALPGLEYRALENVVIPIVGVQFKYRF